MQSVELAYCIRALEMHAAERDENAVAEQRDCKVVDLRLLMRVCRNVEPRTGVARAYGEHRHSLFRERVGEAVGVHIYNHS